MNEMPGILDAMALVLRYDDLGKPYTIIVKNEVLEKSYATPSKILDFQLRRMGSSLKGAKDSAAFVLGSTSMFPVVVQLHPTVNVWFPSESTRNETCVYFSLHQIRDISPYSETEMIVHGYGNYSVVVPVIESKLLIRYQQAFRYLGLMYCNQYLKPASYLSQEEKVVLHCAELHVDYLLT